MSRQVEEHARIVRKVISLSSVEDSITSTHLQCLLGNLIAQLLHHRDLTRSQSTSIYVTVSNSLLFSRPPHSSWRDSYMFLLRTFFIGLLVGSGHKFPDKLPYGSALLRNGSTYQQTNNRCFIYDKCAKRWYQTWQHHATWFWCNLGRKLLELRLCKMLTNIHAALKFYHSVLFGGYSK